MSLDFFFSVLAFVVVGLALDAALYWRMRNALEVFYDIPTKYTYANFALPRLFIVTAASVITAIGYLRDPLQELVIVTGSVMFTISSLYPHFVIYKNSRLR